MAANFDVTPSKEGSILNYLYRQLFYTPSKVDGGHVSLKGKTAIVTGSNCGIGLECCRQFIGLGISRLILAVRSQERGNVAAASLPKDRSLEDGGPLDIQVWELDYSSYDSIQAFSDRAKGLDRIDIVVLNAGSLPTKQTLNFRTGHDECVQVNYLSPALLTILLLEVIKSKRSDRPTRITLTSTDGAAWTSFQEQKNDPILPSLDKPDNWASADRHFLAKLLSQFFLSKLASFVPSSLAVINMSTPGMVHDSNMSRETRMTISGKILEIIRRRMGYTSSVGARHITDAAVNHGPETHGQYLSQQRLKPMAPIIYSPEGESLRERIWKETMEEFSFAGAEEIVLGLARGIEIND